MTASADWPMQLATTVFVAHPDQLDRAQHLYVRRLNAIPTEHARVHFHSDYPRPRSDDFELWHLRCTAVYEARHIDIPDPASLELFEVGCVLSINPEFAEAVSEQLFFADHTAPDPFPGSQHSLALIPFIPGQATMIPASTHQVPASPPKSADPPEPVSTTSWLVTLYLLAAPDETRKLAAEYSRLLVTVRDHLPGLALRSSSPSPQLTDDDAVAGPLWVAAAQRMVAFPTTAGTYPLAQRLHRARLVVHAATDPAALLPNPNLPGSWETEPLV